MNVGKTGFSFLFIVLAVTIGSSACCAESSEEKQADILMFALPATAYLMTLHKKDEPGAWALTKSLGVSAVSTLALNALIDKDSPNGESQHAFPSGHTTIAFSSAAFVQRRYGWRAGAPAYLAASYVGWLRIETDDHDAGDVIGGMAVGILSSYFFTKPFGEQVQVAAWGDDRSGGLRIQYRW
jgi:hypothetical protein